MNWPGVGKGFNAVPRLRWCGAGCKPDYHQDKHPQKGRPDKVNPQRCAPCLITIQTIHHSSGRSVFFFREKQLPEVEDCAVLLKVVSEHISHTLMKEGIE